MMSSRSCGVAQPKAVMCSSEDRKSTRLNSSHANISYAVFCLKKKKTIQSTTQKICGSLGNYVHENHSNQSLISFTISRRLSYTVRILYTQPIYSSNKPIGTMT